jgi:hypothetical protein
VFMEQPTNTAKFIDMNDDLGKDGDNKLIHAVLADGHVHDGEGFGGDDEQNRQFVRPLYPRKTCLEDKDVSGERLPRPPTATLTPRRRSTTQHEPLEQVPRFEEIMDESANSYKQAETNDITDDLIQVMCDELVRGDGGGQAREGLGGGGGRVQARGEPGLDDRDPRG